MDFGRYLRAFSLLSFASLVAWPGVAFSQEAALGNSGELFVVKAGLYGDLFPGGKDADKPNNVLALEITRPGKPAERRLIPDTQDNDIENSPALLFEPDSNTVFLVWESRINSIHSILKLTSFDGSTWSDTLEVTGNPYSLKTSPQLATTRDSYREALADGKAIVKHRTVLHLIWSEENGTGFEAFYSPIILDEGVFIGTNPTYSLNDFLREEAASAGATVTQELLRSPVVRSGRDGRTIVVGFASANIGRLVTLEVDVLPTQLRRLADKARAYIIDLGHGREKPDLPTVATKARAFVLTSGEDFQPEVAQSMADLLYSRISHRTPSPPPGSVGDLGSLAEDARAYIIDLGAKFSGRGLRLGASDSAPGKILQISQTLPDGGSPATPSTHLFRVQVASTLPVPAIGSNNVRVFVSELGDHSLVSWVDKDRVYYRDSQETGWSDIREIKLSDSLSLEKVYAILEQRVRSR